MLKLHIYQRVIPPTGYFDFDSILPKFIAILADDTLVTYPDQTKLTFYDKHAVLGKRKSYQLLCHINDAHLHPEYFI